MHFYLETSKEDLKKSEKEIGKTTLIEHEIPTKLEVKPALQTVGCMSLKVWKFAQ